MKKEYVRPSMVCETFAADEYVAACGDSGKVYKFVCDAPAGRIWYYSGNERMFRSDSLNLQAFAFLI